MSNNINVTKFEAPCLKKLCNRVALAFVVLSLGACATQSHKAKNVSGLEVDGVIEINPDQKSVTSDAELAVDPKLPKLELDASILETLLVMNIASYQGQWDLAAEEAQKAASSSKDYRLARLATLLALRGNNYKKGLESAKLWYELDPEDPDPLNMLLITQLGSGDVDGAKDSILAHEKGKELDSHIKQVAALLIRQKNQEAGLEVAQFLVDHYEASPQAALSASFVAENFKDFELSEAWVEKALELKPGWELAAQMHAKVLLSQNKLDERGQFIAEYVETHPDSIVMRINYAAELLRTAGAQPAYDYMQQVLVDAPRNTSALQYAAALAEDRKDFDQASKYYLRALNINPGDDDVRWSLARRSYIDKQYKVAERHFNDIRTPELLFDAQIQVANTRYELFGLESAINTLASLDPNTEVQYVSLALTRHYLLMSEYQYEEALGAINEVLYYIPDNLELVYARALVAAELKRIDIAEPDFRKIIAAKPDHANALNALGYTLADQSERYDEARVLIEQALKLRPTDAHILDSMGWVAYRQGDFETAIEYLEKAYAESEEVEIATHLAEVYWESGDQERAKGIWFAWLAKERDNRLLIETLQRYGVDAEATAGLTEVTLDS